MVLKLHTCYTPFLRWSVKTHTHFPWSCSELLDRLLGFKELFFVSSFTSFQWRADVRIWRCVGFFIVLLQTYSNPSHTQIRSYQLTEELNYCWAVQESMCLPHGFFQSAVHQVVCLYSIKLLNISFSIMCLN